MQSTVIAVSIALVGLAIGSFICVIIDRLPVPLDEPGPTGDEWDTRPWSEVLGGTSRCSTCGAGVRPRDNIPVIGWLLLRGRCRDCSAPIPSFHPIVELLVPALALLAYWELGWTWQLLSVLWLIPVGVAMTVIDLRTMIVPTRLVWPSFFGAVVCSGVVALSTGRPLTLMSGVIGVLVMAGPLFTLWYVLPSHLGFGDVRLTVFLGWTVGFTASLVDERLAAAAFLAVIAMLLGSIGGIMFGIAIKIGFGRPFPFGPTLIGGAYVALVLAEPILRPLIG